LFEFRFEDRDPVKSVVSVSQITAGIGNRFTSGVETKEIKEKLDAGQVRGFGCGRNRDGLAQRPKSFGRVTASRTGLGVLHQGCAEPVFQICPKVLGPMIPLPNASQPEVVQSGPPPKPSGFRDSPLGQGIAELVQIDLYRTWFQSQRVMVEEEVLTESVFQDPDGLSDRVAAFRSIGVGPEKTGKFVS
jgi:hypothetical protein